MDYRMRDVIQRTLDARRRRLEERVAKLRALDLRVRFGDIRRRLHIAESTAIHAWKTRVALAARNLETLTAHLTQLSPLRVLERGYAIVQNERGVVVKDSADAPPASMVEIRVARARLRAIVNESTEQS
jgi:exodeoxyribonuclease VII large subunit